MKGIILAGGVGSRLYPITFSTSKQLLPIYDKPLIYYPLSLFMEAGIRDILIISTPEDLPRFEALFRDGSHLGLRISYQSQAKPEGIAQAFILAEDFIGDDSVGLVLGDNIFHGAPIQLPSETAEGGLIFAYEVKDAGRYGVIDFDESGNVRDIIEKPANPPSNYAVTGLYFYDPNVVDMAKSLKPSKRGEYEITDLNKLYLEQDRLHVQCLPHGYAWLDTGTPEALHKAAEYVSAIQERQGIKIACIEEIAYRKGFIDLDGLIALAESQSASEYGHYLKRLIAANVKPLYIG